MYFIGYILGFIGGGMTGWGIGGSVMGLNPQPSDPYLLVLGIVLIVVSWFMVFPKEAR